MGVVHFGTCVDLSRLSQTRLESFWASSTTKRPRNSTVDESKSRSPSPTTSGYTDDGDESSAESECESLSESSSHDIEECEDVQKHNRAVCSLHCCSSNSPYRPVASDLTATKRRQGKQNRSFVSKLV